jgi:pilus assembly protein CpaB
MNIRTVLIILLAVVFGLAATFGVRSALRLSAGTVARPAGVPVVVAAADVPRYGTLTVAMLKILEVPKEMVPPGALTRIEDALDRSCTTFVGKGEMLLESKLTAKGVRGVAAGIPKGMRAVTIRTPDVATGVAGFALPGSRVDVLLTTRPEGGSDSTGGTTQVVLQSIEVLAVDQRVDATPDQKMDGDRLRSVTLLVTTEQGAKLQLGQSMGQLHLALRHPLDSTVGEAAVAHMRDFRTGKVERPPVAAAKVEQKAEPPRVKKPKPPPIRTVRGTAGSDVDFR